RGGAAAVARFGEPRGSAGEPDASPFCVTPAGLLCSRCPSLAGRAFSHLTRRTPPRAAEGVPSGSWHRLNNRTAPDAPGRGTSRVWTPYAPAAEPFAHLFAAAKEGWNTACPLFLRTASSR